MICILALLVFGVLSIFSAKYRPLAAEALDCTFRKITLRPCQSGLDQRIRSQITGKLMSKNQKLAGFVFKNFEYISIGFTILLFVSLGYTIYGGYNYYLYGDCNGPGQEGFCIYAALEGERFSETGEPITGELVYPTVDDDPSIGPSDAKVTIIEFGCLLCPFTKKAEPTVQELISKYGYKIHFVYRDFPLKEKHDSADIFAQAANCARDQDKYWEYRDAVFSVQGSCSNAPEDVSIPKQLAAQLKLNQTEFDMCLDSMKYASEVDNDFQAGLLAQVRGTPTFFINNRTIVGPKPINTFTYIIDEELAKQ